MKELASSDINDGVLWMRAIKEKFHQQQWDTAIRPILDGDQGKQIISNMQRYQRQRQSARKVKDESVTRDVFVCDRSSNGMSSHLGVKNPKGEEGKMSGCARDSVFFSNRVPIGMSIHLGR